MKLIHKLTIWIWLAALVASGLVIVHTSFTTDMSAFLPRSPSAVQQVMVDQLHEGVLSRLMLVELEGASPDGLAVLSHDMAKRVRQEPEFASVTNGEDVTRSADYAYLWDNRYVLSPNVTAGHFDSGALHQALQKDLGLLGSNMATMVKRTLPGDPTGEMLAIVGHLAGETRPRDTWRRMVFSGWSARLAFGPDAFTGV